jgi:DNA-binding response OmpR family regulator
MSKILIVEDDISLRDVYSARLQAEGYTIATASNGEEALAVAVKERPDLVLLDIMMPRISGFDVLDIIRTTPEIAHTRVIMMTALSSPEDRERGEKLGVDQYLVKSQVTLEDVVASIKRILSGGSDSKPAAATDEDKQEAKPEQPAA